MRIEIDCPAKINLFLAVGPRDAVGYHPIRSVFQAVGLFDTLSVSASTGETKIVCDWPGMPEENTLTKALRYLGELVTLPPLEVRLTKRIPDRSGLGGGSSDAAALLRAVRELTRLPVSDRDLHEIASAVGADVPFFLVGGRAWAEGYGEKLEPLADAPRRYAIIAKPAVDCPTPEAYRALDRQEYQWRERPDKEEFYNDFERVAPDACKDLLAQLVRLNAVGAGLCGSGSAVFGLFCDEEGAQAAATRLRSHHPPRTWVVPTLSRLESLAFQRS